MCHVRACISLILDIRPPPARPGVPPPALRAGGDNSQNLPVAVEPAGGYENMVR